MQARSGPSHLRAVDPGGQLGLQNFLGSAGGFVRGDGLWAWVSPHGGLRDPCPTGAACLSPTRRGPWLPIQAK